MTTTEEPVRFRGGPGSVTSLEEAISAATAELQLLLADTSRVQPAAAPVSSHPVELYPWQRRALDAWTAAGRRGVVQAVTGAGKTRVGVAAVADALAEGRRAVILAPTLVLVRQWLSVLGELLPGVALSDTLGDNSPWQVLVTTVQSAMRRPAMPYGERALLVVDECHRCGAEGFAQALRPGFGWRLGLTATLERGDDGDAILHGYFGGVIHEVGYREALADGLISPFRFAQVSVPLLPAERATYDELTDNLRGARDKLIMFHGLPAEPIGAFLNAVSVLTQDRTPDGGGALARLYMAKFSARRKLLAETPVKMVALNRLSSAVDASKGAIVFTQTKEASLLAARVLSEAGCVSAAVHGELDQESREERLELFRSGAVASITAPRVLDEGVDVPEADLGIVTAANRSRRQMIQRLGRVLRRRPGKTARFVAMYAQGTVEDPYFGGHLPDFYDTCLPFAADVGRFDLSVEGHPERLLAFLGGEPVEETIVAVHVPTDPGAERPVPTAPEARVVAEVPTELDVGSRLHADGELREPCGGTVAEDPVKDHLNRNGRYRLLSAVEEVELARCIEAGLYARQLLRADDRRYPGDALLAMSAAGDAARETMICANLRLVISLAKRYAGRGLEFLDLIQEGNLGLMHAVEKFDWSQGNKFSTYATWWIKQAVGRAVADQGNAIRHPVHIHEVLMKVRRHLRERHLTWGEALRHFPVGIAELNVSRETLVRLAKLDQPLVSTNQLAEEFDDSVVYAPLRGEGEDPLNALVERLATRRLHDAIISRLAHENPRGAFVLRARFGGVTGEDETLETIGRRLGLTRERVRQIEKASLERARQIAQELTAPVRDTRPVPPTGRRPPVRSRVSPPPGPTPRRAALSSAALSSAAPVGVAAPRRARA